MVWQSSWAALPRTHSHTSPAPRATQRLPTRPGCTGRGGGDTLGTPNLGLRAQRGLLVPGPHHLRKSLRSRMKTEGLESNHPTGLGHSHDPTCSPACRPHAPHVTPQQPLGGFFTPGGTPGGGRGGGGGRHWRILLLPPLLQTLQPHMGTSSTGGCESQRRGDSGDGGSRVPGPTRAPAPTARLRSRMRSSPCRHPGAAPTAPAPQRKPPLHRAGHQTPLGSRTPSKGQKCHVPRERAGGTQPLWWKKKKKRLFGGKKGNFRTHHESNHLGCFLHSHASKEERLGDAESVFNPKD